jgi:hypothetical protein
MSHHAVALLIIPPRAPRSARRRLQALVLEAGQSTVSLNAVMVSKAAPRPGLPVSPPGITTSTNPCV